MFNRPLLQKILLAALVVVIVLFISIEVIYYLFEGQLQQFLENEYVRYAQWTVAIIAGLFTIATFLLTYFPKKIVIEPPTARALLLRLLDNVEKSWVKGILENSIHHAVLLELGKELQPNQVNSPWQMTLELPDQTARLLPRDYTIEHIFTQEATRSLLILGEPGAGKTTTLLELTRRLIVQARTDQDQPIPVVFNLSSWAEKQLPLQEWLASELQVKYQIPLEIGTVWIQKHQLLPLLDGLDEVRAGARAACVAAINAFLPNSGGITGMVVCCRREEYEQLTQHLQLHAAIGLQPLHEAQVAHYVAAGGEHLAGLRALLEKDEDMRTLATSPLMLSIMSLAYQDVPVTAHSSGDTQAQLFDRYIDKMFSRRPAESQRYPKEKALHCLTWLAKQMQQRGQTVFLVERLQPNWVPSTLGYWLLNGAVWSIFWVGLFFIISHDFYKSIIASVLWGFTIGIVSIFSEIETMETLGWSWNKFQREWWKNILLLGLFGGLLVGLFGGMLLNNLLDSLIVGFFTGSLYGLLLAGLENQIPEQTSLVNQGIITSFHNMWYYGTLFGLVIGGFIWIGWIMIMILWTSWTITELWVIGVLIFLIVLLGSMLIGFIWLGGGAIVQHFILRIMLWLKDYTPLNFVGFLDTAARLILLRKVGGGYIFVHRLLLDHLAEKNV